MGSPVITDERVRHEIAVALRTLCEARQWSGNELAKRSGVSQRHIAMVLNEKTGCSVEALNKLSDTLGMPMWQTMICGRAQSTADVDKLSKLVSFYVGADIDTRKVLDFMVTSRKRV